MKKLENYEQILNKIKEEEYFCQVDMPKVEKIVNEQNFPAYYIKASEIPEAVGQLSLFSVPVVILFYEGREIHRQAKIIDFDELNYRLEQISENK